MSIHFILNVINCVWRFSIGQGIYENAQSPKIHASINLIISEQVWGDVIDCAPIAFRLYEPALLGHFEISQKGITISPNKYVFQFHVAIDNIIFVEMLQP